MQRAAGEAPLNPDAFSGFGKDDAGRSKDNAAIKKATSFLLDQWIPTLPDLLDFGRIEQDFGRIEHSLEKGRELGGVEWEVLNQRFLCCFPNMQRIIPLSETAPCRWS